MTPTPDKTNALRVNAQGQAGDLMPMEEIAQLELAASQRSKSVEPAMTGALPIAGTHTVLTVGAAAQLLTATTGWVALNAAANYVVIDCETDAIRYTLDGTAPTGSIGYKLYAGFKGLVLNRAEVAVCKVIRVTTDAALQISQFK